MFPQKTKAIILGELNWASSSDKFKIPIFFLWNQDFEEFVQNNELAIKANILEALESGKFSPLDLGLLDPQGEPTLFSELEEIVIETGFVGSISCMVPYLIKIE